MSYEQSNVGSGMVPCRKGCRCADCTIERLNGLVALQKKDMKGAMDRIAKLEAANSRQYKLIQQMKDQTRTLVDIWDEREAE